MYLLNLFIGVTAAIVIIQPENGNERITVQIVGSTTTTTAAAGGKSCLDMEPVADNYRLSCGYRYEGEPEEAPKRANTFSDCLARCDEAGSQCGAINYDPFTQLCSLLLASLGLPEEDVDFDCATKIRRERPNAENAAMYKYDPEASADL